MHTLANADSFSPYGRNIPTARESRHLLSLRLNNNNNNNNNNECWNAGMALTETVDLFFAHCFYRFL